MNGDALGRIVGGANQSLEGFPGFLENGIDHGALFVDAILELEDGGVVFLGALAVDHGPAQVALGVGDTAQ